jgi:hypothetical protein
MANKDLRCLRQDEIMVGNYITDEWASPGCAFEVITFNQRNVTYGAKFKVRWANTRPVPITILNLPLLGFKVSNVNSERGIIEYECEHKAFDGRFEVFNDGHVEFYLYMVGIDIYFIHQLQQLYLALTLDRLTLKQP